MFEFRNGMLGVTIIALAIAGAVFGSYLAGIESVDHEVIKYRELADMNGAYTYDQNPQYIDFDPSSNYTGYYSENSFVPLLNEYFFAEDEIGFTPNVSDGRPMVNNYKVDYKPIIGDTATVDITSLDGLTEVDGTFRVQYCYDETHGDVRSWHTTPMYSLSDVITHMGLDSSVTNILVSLGGANWDDQPNALNDINLGVILIIPSNQFYAVGNQMWATIANPNLDLDKLKDVVGVSTIYEPYQSFNIDIKSRTVTAYFSSDYHGESVLYSADNMYVCCSYQKASIPRLILSDEMDYNPMTTRITYLNPNDGVWFKEGA